MGHCRFCDKTVLLLGAHPQCQKKYDEGRSGIKRLIFNALTNHIDLSIARQQASHLASSSFISVSECSELIAEGWDTLLDRYLQSGQLASTDVHQLQDAAKQLAIEPETLKRLGVQAKVEAFQQEQRNKQAEQQRVQAVARSREQTLSAIQRGEIPRYPYALPSLPFLLGQDQWLVWLFQGASYYEEKKRRSTVRNSQGFSYHGSYAGRSVSHTQEWSEMIAMGSGMIGLTPKYFYYAGGDVSLRIAYNKMITVRAYSDAVEIVKDGVAAKRQVFQDLDGNFAHSLIQAIASRNK